MKTTCPKTLAAAAALLLLVPSVASSADVETVVTFEGINTGEPVGNVAGVTFCEHWWELQNFPGRPAGDATVALLIGADSETINLSTSASEITLIYFSAVAVTLTGRNAAGDVVDTVTAPATDGIWASLSITATDNVITQVTLDGANNLTVIDDFTITQLVDDPVELLENLIFDVAEINLAQGINNAVDARLDAAFAAVIDANENNDIAACNALDALVHFVEVQWDQGSLTGEQALYLIDATDQIIALLCPE